MGQINIHNRKGLNKVTMEDLPCIVTDSQGKISRILITSDVSNNRVSILNATTLRTISNHVALSLLDYYVLPESTAVTISNRRK